jgi:HD-GYP domain-containing protein (c-di-GMP phosphodiesterase class II)
MQFVSARDVREGMCVAEDVKDPQGRILIARGQRLGTHHIVRLRKFGIESVFIDPNNGEGADKPVNSELRKQCVQILSTSCSKLTQEFSAKKINLDANAIKSATDNLIDALMRSKDPLVVLLDVSTSSDRLMQHAVNTAVLATVLGIDLHLPENMLKDLAAAMLFHDVGMIFLPDGLGQKTEPLTPEEMETLQKHPQLGFEHLVRTDALSSVAANIVLRHHELLDMTGYPNCLGGDKLSLLIRIAAVVETYDSLTSARFGRPAVLPDAAFSYILGHAGRKFAPEVVVALTKHIALYPKGTAVQLNTGECGVVAGTLPKAPMRPVVLIHIDNRGKQLKEPLIVDLVADTKRAVARSAPTLPQLLQIREKAIPPMTVDPAYANLG